MGQDGIPLFCQRLAMGQLYQFKKVFTKASYHRNPSSHLKIKTTFKDKRSYKIVHKYLSYLGSL